MKLGLFIDTMRTWRPQAGAEVRRFVEDIMARVEQLPPEYALIVHSSSNNRLWLPMAKKDLK